MPKALNSPETGTGGKPNTKSACTKQTNTKDSEAPEANTSPEDLAATHAELDTQLKLDEDSAEKTVPLKPLEDEKINLLEEAKDLVDAGRKKHPLMTGFVEVLENQIHNLEETGLLCDYCALEKQCKLTTRVLDVMGNAEWQ